MRQLRAWWLRFTGLLHQERRDDELAEELKSHLQIHIEDNLRSGMSAAEARRNALIKLGGIEQTKEKYRRQRGLPLLETLLRDIGFGLRMLRKSPGFTAVAILTLALGIGANVGAFTLINALLLRELPVRHPEQLVELSANRPDGSVPFSYPMYQEIARGQQVFSQVAAWSEGGLLYSVEVGDELSQETVYSVTGDYYSELGATPLLGRLISREDVDASDGLSSRVAVLSNDFWRRRLGGVNDVVGKQILIEGQPFVVIGVTDSTFTGLTPDHPTEITIPLTAEPLILGDAFKTLEDRSFLWLRVTGRLREGLTIVQARTQLQSFWPDLLKATSPTETPGARLQRFLGLQLDVASASTGLEFGGLRAQFTRPLYALLGIVGLILLLACTNLANLIVARTAVRLHEISLRVALGASRWQLTRQALVEGLLLSSTGAVLGLAFAYWGSAALVMQMTQDLRPSITLDLWPDWRVLGAAIGLAVLTGSLFALVPAWRASREDPAFAVQQNPRSLTGGGNRLRKTLIVVQVVLSFTLVLGAGLLVRTFQKLHTLNLGFEQSRLLEVALNPRPGGYRNLNLRSYRAQLIESIAAIPGVSSATLGGVVVPFPGARKDTVSVSPSDPSKSLVASASMISPGFFQTLGIRLLEGREFEWNDDESHAPVAIISRDIADRLFPGGHAIGQRIRLEALSASQPPEVVGIVANARIFDFREATANVVYLPALQNFKLSQRVTLLIRSAGDPEALSRTVAHQVESLGHEYVLLTRTASQVTARTLTPERMTATLSGFFAGLALLIASIGLYGLMSYTVIQRTREIGLRMALGAEQKRIIWMIVRVALATVALGVAIGIPLAFGASRLLASMLFAVSPNDLLTVALASLILLTAGLLAGLLPARQATKVDPMVALRHE